MTILVVLTQIAYGVPALCGCAHSSHPCKWYGSLYVGAVGISVAVLVRPRTYSSSSSCLVKLCDPGVARRATRPSYDTGDMLGREVYLVLCHLLLMKTFIFLPWESLVWCVSVGFNSADNSVHGGVKLWKCMFGFSLKNLIIDTISSVIENLVQDP